MYELVKYTLWGTGKPSVDFEIFEEMKNQGIAVLPASVIKDLDLQPELKQEWTSFIIQQISFSARQQYIQDHLPLSVPYVILKGTTAAQYYPHPEFRMMGDIDIMPSREHFDTACNELIVSGWTETTDEGDLHRGRHRSFYKNGCLVEVHAFFASMNDPIKARLLDDQIVSHINNTHVLPDLINGLVLIDHINQHLEEGIGLRHIIDWMMYVDKCLNDEQWKVFEPLVTNIGLKTLAVTTTRVCEMYLGSPSHAWSSEADEKLCTVLMDYVISCGNLGHKLNPSETTSIIGMGKIKHPIRLIRSLQERGEAEWEKANNPFLKHFSWVWEGIKIWKETPHFFARYKKARSLDTMFNALGVKRFDDGLVYYENGEYVKREK